MKNWGRGRRKLSEEEKQASRLKSFKKVRKWMNCDLKKEADVDKKEAMANLIDALTIIINEFEKRRSYNGKNNL